MKNLETATKVGIEQIAFLICQYNGQKGTEKQVQKCIKAFKSSMELMIQFCENRVNL